MVKFLALCNPKFQPNIHIEQVGYLILKEKWLERIIVFYGHLAWISDDFT